MTEGLIGAIQARCNELREKYISAYEAIGTSGVFAITMMRSAIKQAENAIAAMDVVAMVRSLEELRRWVQAVSHEMTVVEPPKEEE